MGGRLVPRSVVGLGLLAVLSGCSSDPETAEGERAPVRPVPTIAPAAQRLSLAFDVPGTQGAVLLRLGAVVDKTISTEIRPEPVEEFAVTVLEAFADEDAAVDLRELTVLRVPTDVSYPDPPRLRPGDTVFALYRDQGMLAGGNSETRVVATSEADVVRVQPQPGGTDPATDLSHSQASWLGYTEPFDAMRARFARQVPAGSPTP